MNKTLIVCFISLTCFFGVVMAQGNSEYAKWKQKYGKNYDSNEYFVRAQVFTQNQAKIKAHNQKAGKKFTMKQNKFTGNTQEELKQTYQTLKPQTDYSFNVDPGAASGNGGAINVVTQSNGNGNNGNNGNGNNGNGNGNNRSPNPRNLTRLLYNVQIDWRTSNKVTYVQDQGWCGSCWAFAAVAGFESAYLVTYNRKVDISEMQVGSCTYSNYNGCWGGSMYRAYVSSYWNDGLSLEAGTSVTSSYPASYNVNGLTSCLKKGGPIKIKNLMITNGGDCNSMKALLQFGPIAIAITVCNLWYYYSSGYLSGCGNAPNHGVLLVGVDSVGWIIKNSWGTDWGEDGYIKIDGTNNSEGQCSYSGLLPIV